MGCSKFLVCIRNASQATKLMVAEGFKLNHEKVAVEAVGPPITYVNVYRLPAYLPDDVLTNALRQYGKVKSVTFATVATRQNKLNGVRVVKIEISKPVPNFITIQGHRVMFEYRGMRRVCARCGDNGRMATSYTTPTANGVVFSATTPRAARKSASDAVDDTGPASVFDGSRTSRQHVDP
ncbi:hypothetical protein HPB52_023340 [Rhipicephalus sanguineus]|uniref:RRM domain-containing protein n=1 Tax=Rhipicephalus sanguineus TaxID=34632 RepID=A0A9D4T6I1_RHISA|nr:hypothetical protein HPB52_023340 [Rhipicephalus sanguineus]